MHMGDVLAKEWLDYGTTLVKSLQLELSPVSVSRIPSAQCMQPPGEKVRICRAFLDASKGKTIVVNKANNSCFGASWHLGFHKMDDPKIAGMVKKFVVEGEKLFCSYAALDTLMAQIGEVQDNSGISFLLAPLEKAREQPELVLFVCNAEEACRLLTLCVFLDGKMPKIKIGGPTCRMAVMYPLTEKETNLSFYDYTARKLCNVEKDKLLLSIPYERIPAMVEAIEKCSAGTAKIEYPEEFRQFLKARVGAR
ncbi:MAG: DUF169 domain-containing protein [Candidatus Omnitrophica bacterium]|nr:DUF169 domain-containing protein [Candidatus Omnitrophota bacterium]